MRDVVGMNLEQLIDVLADDEREREKLSRLLAWITEDMASEALTRARKSARRGIPLKKALLHEVLGLTWEQMR